MKTSQAITDGLRRISAGCSDCARNSGAMLAQFWRNSGAMLAQFWRNSGAIILTPAIFLRVAKFLMWVEKNKASMDLLNRLNHADLA